MKKFYLIFTALLLIFLGYYFFVRQHEFEVSFKAKTLPGDVIGTARIWNRSLKGHRPLQVDSLQGFRQIIELNNKQYIYDWSLRLANDSVTKVNVRISEPGRKLLNKLTVPFTEQQIEKDADEIMRKFHELLMMHLEITRVSLIGESVLDSSFCVCSTVAGNQTEKASGMMKYFMPLSMFVSELNLQPDGPPMVIVREWNHSAGSLKFDFCFPIKKTESLPQTSVFEYKQFAERRAIKAEYFGNYITSDRAWYELIHFANRNGYKVDGMPVEVFHNNPNLGANESQWKAEVFLPIGVGSEEKVALKK